MLEEITIENLGVIGRAQIPFGRGLTVVTGETGAGKTMLLTGLSLLMGGKADQGRVRAGAERATVEGRVLVDAGSSVAERVAEAGGELDDDGSLVIVRTVASQGRSRSHLGGRSVPVGVLAELADDLVTVHGQSDQLRLRAPSQQRATVDAVAGPDHLALLGRYREAWQRHLELDAEIAELVERRAEREREAAALRTALAEVERVAPQPGEDQELDAVIARLGHVEELRGHTALAHAALTGDELGVDDAPTAAALVEEARRELEAAARVDPGLEPFVVRAAEIGYLVAELGADVSGYAHGLAADPASLESAHARRAELGTLARAHATDVDGVLAWASEAGLRLLHLDSGDERVAGLQAESERLGALLDDLAAQITRNRSDAGVAMAQAVTAELAGLAMAGAELEVTVEPAEPAVHGRDAVTILLRPHPGAPPTPLGKGASGGELSRVMLAVEVVLAQAAQRAGAAPATFVFDEVDAGVGGRAALEVGARLAALARTAQVVVVTHLAQVAAYADHHLVVTKSSDAAGDVVTQSDVRVVVDEERVAELARMLSGQDGSDAALTHAAELLELGAQARISAA